MARANRNTSEAPLVPPLPVENLDERTRRALEEDLAKDDPGQDIGLGRALNASGPGEEVAFNLEGGQYEAGELLVQREDGETFGKAQKALDEAELKAAMPLPPLTQATVSALIATAIEDARLEYEAKFQGFKDEMQAIAAARANGISAQLVGGEFNCPSCGLRLQGPSMTGQKGALYEHTFQESPKLSGKQCELKGAKFRPPVIFLERVMPLTPKAQ